MSIHLYYQEKKGTKLFYCACFTYLVDFFVVLSGKKSTEYFTVPVKQVYVPCSSPCLFTCTIKRKKHWNILLCLLNKCIHLVHLRVYELVLSREKGTEIFYYACLTSVCTLFISVSIHSYCQEKKALNYFTVPVLHTWLISLLYYQEKKRHWNILLCLLNKCTYLVHLRVYSLVLSGEKGTKLF